MHRLVHLGCQEKLPGETKAVFKPNIIGIEGILAQRHEDMPTRERFDKYLFMFMDDFLKIEQQKTANLF